MIHSRTPRLPAIAAIFLAWASQAPCRPAPPAPTVHIAQGTLVGREDGAVQAFLGIPYAEPPVGPNRWRAPRPATAWQGPRLAVSYGAACLQELHADGRPPWTHEYMTQGEVSEDCLTLNIWTPAASGERRPVLVWIHGGGFGEGSGAVPVYRGAALAGRGIVVVTINYRLGLFGFFAHPEITREAGDAAVSNFGLQDQIAALQWVRSNIAAFGGDPARVTIAGQSAGSVSVHALVASPLARGLFARAIAESGLPAIMPVPTLATAEQTGAAFAREKGATSLAALRAMTPDQLALPRGAGPGGKYGFGLVADGRLIGADMGEPASDVPMIVGQNADEGSAFPGYGAGDAASYQAFLARSFGAKAPDFARLYPTGSDAERAAAVRQAGRDRGLAMIAAWSDHRAGRARAPVWGYMFDHAEPGEGSGRYGAFHSSEIPYVFGTLDMAPERHFTLVDRGLSLAMSSYWVNFIARGDPNGAGLPPWSPITSGSPRILDFNTDRTGERALLPPDALSAYRAYIAAGGRLSMF